MASEHAPQHLRWRLTLLVGALVACVGAACVLWLLWHVERSAAQAGVQEWRAIATSVAQSQARQFGRAVRLGIPLPELPGVQAHFEGVLQRQPVLAAMAHFTGFRATQRRNTTAVGSSTRGCRRNTPASCSAIWPEAAERGLT